MGATNRPASQPLTHFTSHSPTLLAIHPLYTAGNTIIVATPATWQIAGVEGE
jgi:hypothetical protein